jgi:hypothetical protein
MAADSKTVAVAPQHSARDVDRRESHDPRASLQRVRLSQPSRTRLGIAAPVRDALQLLGATLPRNIELRQAIDPDTPMLIADVAELHQIVLPSFGIA